MRLSVVKLILLVVVALIFSQTTKAQQRFPMRIPVDLSSGFGDFRQNRFHAGIDFRTQSQEGKKVYSSVDGFVYRLKMSYFGYGKGLYIKGDDGFIYVYGHLKDFNKKINDFVKTEQIKEKRYFVDLYLPKDSIRVKSGELIAYSGQTGAGAPHLHFEKRTSDNHPLNPQTNGFKVTDDVKPTFEMIGFRMLDDSSLFSNGEREMNYKVEKTANGNYKLDSLVYIKRDAGIYVTVFDQMNKARMRQSVYSLSLYIDDKLYYNSRFDSLDFDYQNQVNVEYYYDYVIQGEKNTRYLFERPSNHFYTSYSSGENKGIISSKNLSVGKHKVKIVAEDVSKNRSELSFDLMIGPSDYIYQLDSIVLTGTLENYFYFTKNKECERIKADSVIIFRNFGDVWERHDVDNLSLTDEKLSFSIKKLDPDKALLSLALFNSDRMVKDNIFCGIRDRGKNKIKMNYKFANEGLILTLRTEQRMASKPRFDLYYQDKLLGRVYPELFTMNVYKAYIAPSEKYEKIDRIDYSSSEDTTFYTESLEDLNIYLVGHKDNQVIEQGSARLKFSRDNFYKPRYISVSTNKVMDRRQLEVNSDHLLIEPEVFECRSNYDIAIKMVGSSLSKEKSGLCWLDKEEDYWVWLDTDIKDGYVNSESTGGGSFVSCVDTKPPLIENLTLIPGLTYATSSPVFTCNLLDSLSGINSDTLILVRIDSEWRIPEYDPEGKKLIIRPFIPLENGEHHIGIEVRDRAGNVTEYYNKFFTRTRVPNQKK